MSQERKMTNVVTKSTIIPDTWKNFYDRIKDQVTTVEITGSNTITVDNYVSSFPDKLLDSKSNYPIIVVEDPNTPTENFTSGKTRIDGSIVIGVYTNQSESASKLLAKIIDSIETYKGDLSTVGIKEVKVSGTSQDSATRGEIKLHYREVTFNFIIFYNKTNGF